LGDVEAPYLDHAIGAGRRQARGVGAERQALNHIRMACLLKREPASDRIPEIDPSPPPALGRLAAPDCYPAAVRAVRDGRPIALHPLESQYAPPALHLPDPSRPGGLAPSDSLTIRTEGNADETRLSLQHTNRRMRCCVEQQHLATRVEHLVITPHRGQ